MINPLALLFNYRRNRAIAKAISRRLDVLLKEHFFDTIIIPEIAVSSDRSQVKIFFKTNIKDKGLPNSEQGAGADPGVLFLETATQFSAQLRAAAELSDASVIEFVEDNFWMREAKEWFNSILVALVLTLIIRTYVVQAFKIPSGSMLPTLQIGDKLFVNKYIYRFEEPRRGDIIVFRYPVDPKKDFIKRLVALGGDEVEIRDGSIYVNGEAMDNTATFGKFYYYNHDPFGAPHQLVKVPADHYFVLGDNSANSTDSRFWGFVPKKNVLGKAIFRWWPLGRLGKIE